MKDRVEANSDSCGVSNVVAPPTDPMNPDWSPHVRWEDLPPVAFNSRFTGKRIEGKNLLMVRTDAHAGYIIPKHHHESEQITVIQSGSWQFNVAGKEFEAAAGDVIHVPAGWDHSAVALEDSVALDFFTPPRHEWDDDADQYLWGV